MYFPTVGLDGRRVSPLSYPQSNTQFTGIVTDRAVNRRVNEEHLNIIAIRQEPQLKDAVFRSLTTGAAG